jgi:hypothetical protein
MLGWGYWWPLPKCPQNPGVAPKIEHFEKTSQFWHLRACASFRVDHSKAPSWHSPILG